MGQKLKLSTKSKVDFYDASGVKSSVMIELRVTERYYREETGNLEVGHEYKVIKAEAVIERTLANKTIPMSMVDALGDSLDSEVPTGLATWSHDLAKVLLAARQFVVEKYPKILPENLELVIEVEPAPEEE